MIWHIGVLLAVVMWCGWAHARIDNLEERLRIHVRRSHTQKEGDDDN